MEKKDVLVHYVISKKENKKPKMKTLVQSVFSYIQNHEIYFKYEPSFYSGVLLFGVIGFKKDHTKLKEDLGSLVDKLDCQLQTIAEKPQ